jgi:hypothetical protein
MTTMRRPARAGRREQQQHNASPAHRAAPSRSAGEQFKPNVVDIEPSTVTKTIAPGAPRFRLVPALRAPHQAQSSGHSRIPSNAITAANSAMYDARSNSPRPAGLSVGQLPLAPSLGVGGFGFCIDDRRAHMLSRCGG